MIAVARYCQRHDYWDPDGFSESGEGLVDAAITGRRHRVHDRLLEILGEARLFTSLAIAGIDDPGPHYDDVEEEDEPQPVGRTGDIDAFDPYMDQVLNFDMTPDTHRTYEWLVGALDLN